MRSFPIRIMQTDETDTGRLRVQVTSASGAVPIPDADVAIYYTGEPGRQLEDVNRLRKPR